MTKFQEELRAAITECYRMKRVDNNEDIKRWREHHELAQQKLESLINRCCDVRALESACKLLHKNCGARIKGKVVQDCLDHIPEYWIEQAEKENDA